MTPSENDRPAEWLRWLSQEPGAYYTLLFKTGGLASAAYRIARARCRVRDGFASTPTLRELEVAVRLLAAKTGQADALPIRSVLASDREEAARRSARPLPPSSALRRASAPALAQAS